MSQDNENTKNDHDDLKKSNVAEGLKNKLHSAQDDIKRKVDELKGSDIAEGLKSKLQNTHDEIKRKVDDLKGSDVTEGLKEKLHSAQDDLKRKVGDLKGSDLNSSAFFSKHKWKIGLAALIIGIMLVGIISIGNSEVSLVKDAPLPIDKSITYGKLFSTYKYCKDGKWTVKKTERGQSYVEFKGKYLSIGTAARLLRDGSLNKSQASTNIVAEHIDSLGLNVSLVAQFMMGVDGKSFSTNYVGLEYKGESSNASNKELEYELRRILKNELIESLPEKLASEIKYTFISNLLKKNKNIMADYATLSHADRSWGNLCFISIDDIFFEDASQKISFKGKIHYTDIGLDRVAGDGKDNGFDYLSNMKSFDLKNHVKQTYNIYSETKFRGDTMSGIWFSAEVKELSDNSRGGNRKELVHYGIKLLELAPLKVNIELSVRTWR